LIAALLILAASVFLTRFVPRSVFSLESFLKPQVVTKTLTRQEIVEEESAVIELVEQASPSVVSIVARRVGFDPLTGPYAEESGIGTGFIVDRQGTVLTNRHVVANGDTEYSVVTSDKKTYEVLEIHRDTLHDLAILKTTAVDINPLELGDSERLKVGQTVVAIGNALGRFSNTVTKGVVSGIGRGISARSSIFGSAELLENVIQTDAALNPGNSGGPLLNLAGQAVGINVAIGAGAENIGFSIPINVAKPVLEDFAKHGRIIRPFLGVEYIMISKELAALRRLPEGAFIKRVAAETPAARAGLKAGDIIVRMGGEDVSERNTLARVIQKRKVGERVELVVDRGGEEVILSAVLAESKRD